MRNKGNKEIIDDEESVCWFSDCYDDERVFPLLDLLSFIYILRDCGRAAKLVMIE